MSLLRSFDSNESRFYKYIAPTALAAVLPQVIQAKVSRFK
jgi:hypothetical protein